MTADPRRVRSTLARRGLAPLLALGALLLAPALLYGCADATAPIATCSTRSDCPGGYTCDPRTGQCVDERECEHDGQCCPGALCFEGTCRLLTLCEADLDCDNGAGICDRGICVAAPCTGDDDCGAPYHCFEGRCAARPVCGGCRADEVCELHTNRCLPATSGCDPTTCGVGEVAIVDNTEAMRTAGPQCDPAAATCTCARLPKLAPPRPGGRLALVRVGSEYLVLGRDPNYGDLVAATPTQPTTAGGSAGGAEFGPGVGVTSTGVSVAGVPVGPVVADPTGPRGGVAAPGADVGRFVAAVGFETHASVIAHDASAGQLEYLELRPVARVVGGVASSAWVTSNSHAIDTERDSGFGASLVAGPEGALHAAWFARRADGVESLRYATAVAPSSVLDWQRAVIVSEPTIGATGCEGCSPLQVCVQGDSDPECAIPSLVPTCDPTCDRRSLCVQGACRRVVRPGTGRPFLDRPGSSTTIAMRAGGLLLAWYDRHAGALRLGSGAPGVDFTHAIVDGGKGDDVGRLARLDWRPTTSSSPSSTATRPATGCGCCTEVPSTR